MPARSAVKDFEKTASDVGIELMPWQRNAARYLTALGPHDRWLYPEVAIVVARQNGKTRLLVPLIVSRLMAGKRIMHTAQNRELPREVFAEVADIFGSQPKLLRKRGKRVIAPRFANGTEEIVLANGGIYRIVSPRLGGIRGHTSDLVIIDELRESTDFDFIKGAKPSLQASPNPQMVYLSNAGEDHSVVLNSIRDRAAEDPGLAYLEWSAAPDRSADDRLGWSEANPAIGHLSGMLDNLERDYLSHKLGGTLTIFETENLCRWVKTMRERLVDEHRWNSLRGVPGPATRTVMGISMDPTGKRASAVIAWQQPDGLIGVQQIAEVFGDPIDLARFGEDLKKTAAAAKVTKVAFDPMTDAELAKYFRKPEPVTGSKWVNASATFVNLVTAGHIVHADSDAVTDDLSWVSRKVNDERGSFAAVRSVEDHPITAALAAIRAVWLASGPSPSRPKVL